MEQNKLIERANAEAMMLYVLAEMIDTQFKEVESAKLRAGVPPQNLNTAKNVEQKRVLRSMAQVARQYAIMTRNNHDMLNDGCQELAKYFRALLLLVIDRSRQDEDIYKCYRAIERLKSKRDMNLEHSRRGAWWKLENELKNEHKETD